MPRALYIYTHEFFPKRGGIATYCHEFATAATHLIDQVVVIGPKGAQPPDGDISRYSLEQGCNQGSHNPTCIWKTRQHLRQCFHQNPNAIHLLAEPGPILAYGMLPKTPHKTHVALTLHGSEIERWHSNPISKAIARRAFRNTDTIQAVSTPVLQSLRHYFPEAAGQAKVIHNALPEGFRQFENSTKPTHSDIMELLSVGRIHPRKGFDQIIRALALLSNEDKSRLHYTIAGAAKDVGYLKRLRQLAKTAQIQMDVTLNPNFDQLNRCYAAADLFALTSMPRKKSVEGFGIVYLEAGAHSLPCLAYNTGGVREAIRDGITGTLVETSDVVKLSEQIRFFLQNPQTRQLMGNANRMFALSRSWVDVVKETLVDKSRIKERADLAR